MSVEIIKSTNVTGGYYINGKSILIENWDFHKRSDFFSDAEKEAFNKHIKAIK